MSEPPSPSSFVIQAGLESAGQRLDIFLSQRIGTISRSRVKALLLQGAVSRNGAPATNVAEPVQPGATYTLIIPAAAPATPGGQHIAFPILYEDAHVLVLDKPAGLVVHPAPGNPDGTLVNALIAHCGTSLTGIGGQARPGIVHRLDKDTSGIMVVAKTQAAHTGLSIAFAARDIDRQYQAICWGLPSPAAQAITGDIGRDPRERKRMAVVTRNGKTALTNIHRLEAFGTAAARLAVRLATGRTHQIRVHLAHIGHPLVGDPVYLRRRPAAAAGLPATARDFALDFPRQALHAETLGFIHPITSQALSFQTPPPADFQQLRQILASGMSNTGPTKSDLV